MNTALTNTTNEDRKFTVLLLQPDDIADAFGQDTFMAHVEAPDAETAETLAQEQVRDAYCKANNEDTEDFPAENFHVLAVFEGHLNNLKTN